MVYLGYAPRKFELQLSPTALEKNLKLIPNTIAVIGKYYIDQVKMLDNSINVIVAPAFRYNYLWSIKKKSAINNKFNFLIALPILG